MTAVPSREVTTSQIESVSFSFYSDEEIRKLSVKQITSPMSLDGFRRPVPNGLYDPALGPLKDFDPCGTCGLRQRACPGHFGHIELAVPVYNPLVFRTLYKLLRCTCLHCFKFRMAEQEVDRFAQQMELLAEGRLVEAADTVTHVAKSVAGAAQQMLKGGEEASPGAEEASPKAKGKAGRRRAGGAPSRGAETVHTIEAARECQLAFFKHMPAGACANCRAHSPVIKAEGSMKLFQKPLEPKKEMANRVAGVRLQSLLTTAAEQEGGGGGAMELDAKPEDEKADVKPGDEKGDVKVADAKEEQPAEGQQAPASQLRYMTPAEVEAVMARAWAANARVLRWLYALQRRLARPGGPPRPAPLGGGFAAAYAMFFVRTVAVPPTNVRPLRQLGDAAFEHPQNLSLVAVLNANLELLSGAPAPAGGEPPSAAAAFGRSINAWLRLQGAVNALFDTSTAQNVAPGQQGIRQLLEKKEGLFRKNMMGKRVNFAARSVISPDPYLGTGEIGVPPYFAVRLSLPERVTPLNVQELREMVVRGPHEHPGANAVEDESGRMVNLTHQPRARREALAKQLLSRQGSAAGGVAGGGKIVYRHLRDGDSLLTNRQPTLHKPGLMAHNARVLKGERTIRMHYANCATFNADFDGDEINLHLPQDLLARAEAAQVVHADHQYCVPTDGKPIRGLIQDHVVAGVLLTKRDTFLSAAEAMQLLYAAVCPSRPGHAEEARLALPPPALLRPRALWTGKQVVGAVLARLVGGRAPMTLEAACKTGDKYWGADSGEASLVLHRGELVAGTMDKAQYGKFGLVHGVQELYGDSAAGELLSCLSRLWTAFLQARGFTCGISDLLLRAPAEEARGALLAQAEGRALAASAEFAGLPPAAIAAAQGDEAEAVRLGARVRQALSERYRSAAATGAGHDRRATSSLQPLSSEVVDLCLPGGLAKPFPANCLSMMTVTGAKGSQVNFSQISCLLGQQELEGRRVPRMASGKTLPCFAPYDGGARSGGYVGDRFLAGLAPQEYYFHCMAGREGLVDTTVKTSRSGYLQRCLVKNLESLRVHYDGTVRDNCDGSVVQFQYGEDSIDVLSTSFLGELRFLAANAERLRQQQLPGTEAEAQRGAAPGPLEQQAAKQSRWRQKQLSKQRRGKKAEDPGGRLPVAAQFFATLLGVTSERHADAVGRFIEESEGAAWLPRTPGKRKAGAEAAGGGGGWAASFQRLMELRYLRALVAPGEAVGVIAAQSIGEPSTQMTLNTFHMAGRGEANVTLGIPRLRELFMTAAQAIKTPVMTLPLRRGRSRADAEALAGTLRRVKLAEVLEGISIEESIVATPGGGGVSRQYLLRLQATPEPALPAELHISFEEIAACFSSAFMRQLSGAVKRQLQAATAGSGGGIQSMSVAAAGEAAPAAPREAGDSGGGGRKRGQKDDEDENAEQDEENEEGKLRFAGGRGERGAMYDQGDAEDRAIAREQARAAEAREATPEPPEPPEEARPEGQEGSPGDAGDALGTSPGAQDKGKAAPPPLYQTAEEVDGKRWRMSARVTIPLAAPKVLMLELAERIATTTMLRHTRGIEKCYVVEGAKDAARPDETPPPAVQTDGINFEGAWALDDVVDVDRLTTNDVGSILHTFGVEAARATLLREVSAVFGAYGIGVDQRHLGLIADFMTQQGGYRPCNRLGIESSASPFLKITFETAAHFLTDATLAGSTDALSSPAARIVLGRVVELGTGAFELRQQLKEDGW